MRRLSIRVSIFLTLIILLGWAMFFVIYFTEFWTLIIWITLAEIVLFYYLIRNINKHRRQLNMFVESISQDDFQNTYTLKKPDYLEEDLFDSFDVINNKLKDLREQKEANHFFLQTIVLHINIPIMVYNDSEKITLMNESLEQLLRTSKLHSLQNLERISPDLANDIRSLKSNQRKLISVVVDGELLRLAVQASQIKLGESFQKIVSIQDLRTELEAQELEAYQKLIRVLNHEIMNSAIPISTLSGVLNDMLQDKELSVLSDSEKDDVTNGLNTIKNRSQGLVKFLKSYKSFTKNPELEFNKVSLHTIVNEVHELMKPSFEKEGIILELKQDQKEIFIEADTSQISQVIINLLKNALESVINKDGEGKVTLSLNRINESPVLEIKDNGDGISRENLEQIFVPFYSTKESGSGIGLSLSRKIMRLHNGSISVSSIPGETNFRLNF